MVKLRLIDFVMKICVCLPYLNLQIFNKTVEYMFGFSTRKQNILLQTLCLYRSPEGTNQTETEARAVQVVATCSVTSRWH